MNNFSCKFIFTVTLFLCFISHSQEKTICGEVNYQHITQIEQLVMDDYLLKFNNEESYAEEINIKSSKDTYKDEYAEQRSTENNIVGRANISPRYFYNKKTQFYFKDIFFDKALVVKEDSFDWNWEIYTETKQIGNFNCQKATIDFRGRTYIAWYSDKIPVPFGPWKFQGLPGLIFEVYDTDKSFHIIANNIKVGETVNCSFEINQEEIKNATSIQNYIKEKDDLVNAMFAKLSSQLPKGTPALKWNKDCEDCGKEIEKF